MFKRGCGVLSSTSSAWTPKKVPYKHRVHVYYAVCFTSRTVCLGNNGSGREPRISGTRACHRLARIRSIGSNDLCFTMYFPESLWAVWRHWLTTLPFQPLCFLPCCDKIIGVEHRGVGTTAITQDTCGQKILCFETNATLVQFTMETINRRRSLHRHQGTTLTHV